MRLLFKMDAENYWKCTHTEVRNSSRGIIIRGSKIAMVHSLKYDYYKFPGGGLMDGEPPVAALIRETREEAGLIIKPETIKEYGYVHRIQKSYMNESECFVQDNYYYLCEVKNEKIEQKLDRYEAEESFTLEYVYPETVIVKNRSSINSSLDQMMLNREARVLELLMKECVI